MPTLADSASAVDRVRPVTLDDNRAIPTRVPRAIWLAPAAVLALAVEVEAAVALDGKYARATLDAQVARVRARWQACWLAE